MGASNGFSTLLVGKSIIAPNALDHNKAKLNQASRDRYTTFATRLKLRNIAVARPSCFAQLSFRVGELRAPTSVWDCIQYCYCRASAHRRVSECLGLELANVTWRT